MIYSVSNIAWPTVDRLQAYAVLADQGFEGLEIAPSLFFFDAPDPFGPGVKEYDRALGEIAEAGLTLVSMQSLLFGVEGAELFGDEVAMQHFQSGMTRAIRLAGRLHIPNIVFGSPKQRVIPDGMSMQQAQDRAANVFSRLGDIAKSEGTVIAMEANPAVYGTNFLTHGEQALEFVQRVDHPAVRFILDVGAMQINGAFNRIHSLIADSGHLLSHVHFSEPQLAPAPANAQQAGEVLRALNEVEYNQAVSIEMRAAPEAPILVMASAVGRLAQARRLTVEWKVM